MCLLTTLVFKTRSSKYGDYAISKLNFIYEIVMCLDKTSYYKNSNLQNNNCYEDNSLEKITIFFYIR